MSHINCDACTELRETSPEFVQNGVTDFVAKSLKNNRGLNSRLSALHNNCEDLQDVLDCLIGRMSDEVEAYDVCDWKDYMKKFIPNLYETLKAMLMAQCGLWCKLEVLMNGFSFRFGESSSGGTSYIVAGKGVSYLTRGEGKWESDAHIMYVAGGLMLAYGNLEFFTEDFTDADGTQREGNPEWGVQGSTVVGNELILEYRVKMSEYPEIKSFHSGFGALVNQGNNTILIHLFNGGRYAYGQHGDCDPETGEPDHEGNSPGVYVPNGWTYIQLRMNYNETPVSGASSKRTPRCLFGVRLNMDGISC